MNSPEITLNDLYIVLQKMQGDIGAMRGDIGGMKGDINGMQGDISGMQGDISGMKGDISGMQGDINGMRGDISIMQGDISRMATKQDLAGLEARTDLGFVEIMEFMKENVALKSDLDKSSNNTAKINDSLTGLALKNEQEIVMTGSRIDRLTNRVAALETARA